MAVMVGVGRKVVVVVRVDDPGAVTVCNGMMTKGETFAKSLFFC